jgi:hypothetical protein
VVTEVVASQKLLYPREQCTDREADKIIETITPETREKLIKLAVDYGITKL